MIRRRLIGEDLVGVWESEVENQTKVLLTELIHHWKTNTPQVLPFHGTF